jgi:hypothetical protein
VPESCVSPTLEKREGAGNAGCFSHTHSLMCEGRKHMSVVTTGQPKHRHSLRDGVSGLFACSPRRDRALLSPSPRGLSTRETWHLPLGHQAYTPSPSASTPSSRAPLRPSLPTPRVVTIAIRPSCRGGMGGENHSFPKSRTKISFEKAEILLDVTPNHFVSACCLPSPRSCRRSRSSSAAGQSDIARRSSARRRPGRSHGRSGSLNPSPRRAGTCHVDRC